MPINKVYEVSQDFVVNNSSYFKGQKYELSDEIAAQAPDGSIKEFVPPVEPEPTTEPVPAKPWMGNHTVGQKTK